MRSSALIALSTFMISTTLFAQGDFFFTFELGDRNADESRDFELGDSGSLWIYWSTNGPADSDLSVGAFIDVFSSNPNVLQFTSATTFDFCVFPPNVCGRTRLGDGAFGTMPAPQVTADLIDEMFATNVDGFGILESNNGSQTFLDEGYNSNNDGFLWGQIEFDIVGLGQTTVTGSAGKGGIINGQKLVDATFTSATINVTTSIPEPSIAVLLAVAAVAGLHSRLRKR